VEVVERHLALAEDLGRRLNAFTLVTSDSARTEAHASAQRYARGEARSVLDGVPVCVKDNIRVAGTATTCASAAADDAPADTDADIVARLRHLGAVVIGKNNLLEYAFGTVHPDFGPARNPWDPERSASGSSSGGAVAIAAGIGFGAIGTDTAGSVRCPAAACGSVGLKPTYGTLPVAGVVPLATSLDHVGLITRTVDDARLLFDALSGRAPLSAGSRPLRLGVADLGGATPEVRAAVDAALDRVAAEGVELVPTAPVPWTVGNAAALALIAAEALEVHAARLAARWHAYSRAMRTRVVAGGIMSGADYVRAQRVREELTRLWHRSLRQEAVDAVLSPTLPAVAPLEGEAAQAAGLDDGGAYTSVYALLRVPAITVPVALGPDGLPIGLQVAAAAGEDGVVLDVAARVEAGRGPWPRPPLGADPFALA
jgi:aspartyl-tRNA(Asn)/glutamyl-tRNA(Gln) amidotransferase subunit A